jgi:hypothetical protein
MSSHTVSDYATYDVSNIVFSKEVKKEIPNKTGTGPGIRFFRIPISTRNADGSVGKLIFAPRDLFTFGVSTNKNDSGAVTGYTLPLTLWNKDGATDDQTAFISTIENVIKACKEHLVSIRKTIMKPSLTFESLIDLDKLLYYKLGEDGERVPGRGPAMYPKLFTKMIDGSMNITTGFIDSNGNDIDPISLIGKYGHTTPALFIDNIYIGSKISLQVYVGEAIVNLVNSGHRGILPRPKADTTLHLGEALHSNLPPPRLLAPAPPQAAESEPVDAEDQIADDDDVVEPTVAPPRAAPKKLASAKRK